MTRHQSFRAIILKKRSFLENDLIINVLTEEGYHQELFVKGAGSGQSKRRSHLELMNLIEGNIYQSKKHLYLQEFRSEKSFWRLKENLDAILESQKVLQLIQKSIQAEDPHPEIFKLLFHYLDEQNSPESHPLTQEITLIQLAHHFGFLPSLKECSQCHHSIEDDTASWDRENRTLHCFNCQEKHHQNMALKYRKALEFLRRQPLKEAPKLRLTKDEHQELQSLLDQLLTH